MKVRAVEIGLVLRTAAGAVFRVLDSGGQTLVEIPLERVPLASPAPDGSWWLVAGNDLLRVAGPTPQPVASGLPAVGVSAALRVDGAGNAFYYAGDAQNTLMAWDAAGSLRWRGTHPPAAGSGQAPLLAVGGGCLLYVLDASGLFSAYRAADGVLAARLALYPGSSRAANPAARMLWADGAERVTVSAGFLSQMTFNGALWGGCQTG